MKFVLDPSIQAKIQKMKARVRWKSEVVEQLNIDQTRLQLDPTDHPAPGNDERAFSFLVLGDSGSRSYYNDNPQRRVAEAMVAQSEDCQFVLHTGDVVYLVGSREQYPKNFIEPYREFLSGGKTPKQIRYDRMCFRLPFLPVLGNHDYYDLPFIFGLLLQLAAPLRRLLRNQINLDLGWHGSFQGDAYARAFLDYLSDYKTEALRNHLQEHYTAELGGHACLSYRPEEFTRLPNRYYQFCQGGIDFFALDSNTFNAPLPLPRDSAGTLIRQQLEEQQKQALQREQALVQETLMLDGNIPAQMERLEDNNAKLEQVRERLRDLQKQLDGIIVSETIDEEQLDWLTQRLIASWQDTDSRGRVLYFHHPPYVTETSKWDQGQTLAVRHRLRQVLDAVEKAVTSAGKQLVGRSVVDLVICGHAHCLEHLRTGDTGHGDRNTHWLVCGGSGFSLRRQRREGNQLQEMLDGQSSVVAESKLFVGRSGQGREKRRPYSFLRISVTGNESAPIYNIHPQVVERRNGNWATTALSPIVVAPGAISPNQN